jgi:hypothetical protein
VNTGNSWAPGDLLLLESFTNNGGNDLRDALAKVNPNTTCVSSLRIKSGGTVGAVTQGMNVRMDEPGNLTPTEENDPQYAPAANVIKGVLPNNAACSNFNSRSNVAIPYPWDDCFMTGMTPNAGNGCVNYMGTAVFGNGNWDRNDYWAINHPGVAQPATIDVDGTLVSWANATRYDVYRYEINHAPVAIMGDEKSAPSCLPPTNPPSTNPNNDRRVFIVAVVNCIADQAKLTNGTPIPLRYFAKVFLTEPYGTSPWRNQTRTSGAINVAFGNNSALLSIEMMSGVTPNDPTGVTHAYPVLYR